MLTKSEREYVAVESAKHRDKLIRQLRKVDRTGSIGRDACKTLLVNGLVEQCGPRPEINNPYNCLQLTDNGAAMLNKLAIEKKYDR